MNIWIDKHGKAPNGFCAIKSTKKAMPFIDEMYGHGMFAKERYAHLPGNTQIPEHPALTCTIDQYIKDTTTFRIDIDINAYGYKKFVMWLAESGYDVVIKFHGDDKNKIFVDDNGNIDYKDGFKAVMTFDEAKTYIMNSDKAIKSLSESLLKLANNESAIKAIAKQMCNVRVDIISVPNEMFQKTGIWLDSVGLWGNGVEHEAH